MGMSSVQRPNNHRSRERKFCMSLPPERPEGIWDFDLIDMKNFTKTPCILWNISLSHLFIKTTQSLLIKVGKNCSYWLSSWCSFSPWEYRCRLRPLAYFYLLSHTWCHSWKISWNSIKCFNLCTSKHELFFLVWDKYGYIMAIYHHRIQIARHVKLVVWGLSDWGGSKATAAWISKPSPKPVNTSGIQNQNCEDSQSEIAN